MEECFLSSEVILTKKERGTFTPKEINIISCILNGGSAKTIAKLLGGSRHTINTHMKNIREGIGGSRAQIIKTIQSLDNYRQIQERYIDLLLFSEFQGMLKKIEESKISPEYKCVIHTDLKTVDKYILLKYLESSGLEVNKSRDLTEYPEDEFHIICCSENSKINLDNLNTDNIVISENHSNNTIDLKGKCIETKENGAQYKCYSSLLGCFSKIYSSEKVDGIIDEFKEYYNKLKEEQFSINTKQNCIKNYIEITDKRKTKYIIAVFVALITFLLFAAYVSKNCNLPIVSNIRSVANDKFLLRRGGLLLKMDDTLKKQEGVKYVVLTGQGGIGKTTLAKDYLSNNSSKTKYEINAETESSTMNAFFDLAIELAKKSKDLRDELSYIQAVQNQEIKKNKIISFVFSQLKEREDWILLFDNIDDFKMIQKFLPCDSALCGVGKVIITTRDTNCENMSFFPNGSILNMEYLEENEKSELFYKIYKEKTESSKEQKEEISNFLKNIPSMPLDISTAAYYLKNTVTSFEEYLKIIESSSDTAEQMQSKFLEEGTGGVYDKTRYKIISTTFNKLIEMNVNFKELLLFVCLLDSQNIPRRYLDQCKDPMIVSDFLHNLRKFSFVESDRGTFSIHRSIQKIGLKYILSLLSEKEKTLFFDKIVNIMTPYKCIVWWFYKNTDVNKIPRKEAYQLAEHLDVVLGKVDDIYLEKKEEYKTKLLLTLFWGYRYEKSYKITRELEDKILKLNKSYISKYDYVIFLINILYCSQELNEENEKHLKVCLEMCLELGNDNFRRICSVLLARFYCRSEQMDLSKKFLQEATTFKKDETNYETFFNTLDLYCDIFLADIYAGIFLERYIVKSEIKEALAVVLKIFKKYNIPSYLHKNYKLYKQTKKHMPFQLRIRRKLTRMYSALEKYNKAKENYREAVFICENNKENTAINTKLNLDITYAHILARSGHLKEANDLIVNTINAKLKLNDFVELTEAFVYKSEIDIRLNNLKEAFEDCELGIKYKKESKTNFAKLIEVICYYNMAIVKHKLSDVNKALEYFQKFFELSMKFCKGFLDKRVYEKLLNENAFEIIKDKSHMQKCLQNSLKIFTAIYGENHSFVKDYVTENCKDYSWIQKKIIIFGHYIRYYIDLLKS